MIVTSPLTSFIDPNAKRHTKELGRDIDRYGDALSEFNNFKSILSLHILRIGFKKYWNARHIEKRKRL